MSKIYPNNLNSSKLNWNSYHRALYTEIKNPSQNYVHYNSTQKDQAQTSAMKVPLTEESAVIKIV